MSRCQVCGYSRELPNDFTPFSVQKYNNRVQWRKKYKEFQCEPCFNAIESTILDDEYNKSNYETRDQSKTS